MCRTTELIIYATSVLLFTLTACSDDEESADTVTDTGADGCLTDGGCSGDSGDGDIGTDTTTDPGAPTCLTDGGCLGDGGSADAIEGDTAADDAVEGDTAAGDTAAGDTGGPLPCIAWDDGISDIFADSCSSCHGWASTYDGVVGRIDEVENRVNLGHQIGGDDQSDLLGWIEAGYREQCLTWNSGISDIFSTNCSGCHGWASTYDGVVGRIDDVENKVERGHQIGGDDQTDLLGWIEAGYPE